MDWISIPPDDSYSDITNPNRSSFRIAIRYTSGAPGDLAIPLGQSQVHRANARAPGRSDTS